MRWPLASVRRIGVRAATAPFGHGTPQLTPTGVAGATPPSQLSVTGSAASAANGKSSRPKASLMAGGWGGAGFQPAGGRAANAGWITALLFFGGMPGAGTITTSEVFSHEI